MPTPLRLQLRIEDPDNVLWPIMGLYTDYLAHGRYGAKRHRRYTASALHFGDWLHGQGAGAGDIDETRIGRFLTGHLPTCSCDHPTPHGLILNRAALNNLLRVLRTIRVMAGAVRCYLRYRALVGDDVAHLRKAVPRPAFWRDAELPEALSAADVERLLSAFDKPCPSRRRGYAIVRCLADLGLRSSEVVRLTLDDIDWTEGVIRVAAGKARRSDILPLSPATGEAIVDYILKERPATARREVFVRHVAPLGEPVGRRVVQKTLHAAYARLGWDRSRVHILRHTLATRLVNSGVPMKQIAGVLRHRSIVTSAKYARVDIAWLSAVASSACRARHCARSAACRIMITPPRGRRCA